MSYTDAHTPLAVSGSRGVACVFAGWQRIILFDLVSSRFGGSYMWQLHESLAAVHVSQQGSGVAAAQEEDEGMADDDEEEDDDG